MNRINQPLIPKVIHQTFPAKSLPPAFAQLAEQTRRANPTWRYEYYDDGRAEDFIASNYGPTMLDRYLRIDPHYGAARADLFRYLLILECGGLYLDSKSVGLFDLSSHIRNDDALLLGQWRNGPGEEHEGYGMHRDLKEVAGGEFQQWWVAAAPGHKMMGRVVDQVCKNLDSYNPWRHNVGRRGVLRTTGPIAFTCAMISEPHHGAARFVNAQDDLGLFYAPLSGRAHERYFKSHYRSEVRPVVRPRGTRVLTDYLFSAGASAYKLGLHTSRDLKHAIASRR